MKITRDGQTLTVTDLDELATVTADSFQSELSNILPEVTQLNIDLSKTVFVDCGGLGALIALRNSVRHQHTNLTIRLLNPTRPVRRMFEITRMEEKFSIDQG